MLRKRPTYLVLVVILTAALTVFMTGCSPEEKAEGEQDKQDKNNINEYKVEVQAEPQDAGEIVMFGDGTYDEGRTLVIEAEPEKGAEFKGWKNEEGEIISTSKKYKFDVKEDKDLVAQFTELKEVNLRAGNDEKGSVVGAGYYEYGEEVSIRAEPETGVEFKGWKNEKGEIISTSKRYRIEVKEDRNLVAQFADLKEDVTITEKQDDVNWPLDEVIEGANIAFSTYYSGPPIINEIDKEIDIQLENLITEEDQVKAEASISYPHIDNDKFDQLEQKIQDKILSESKQGSADLHKIAGQIIQDEIINTGEFLEKTTRKTIVIEKTDTFLEVTHYDDRDELFASFDELYQQAVANHIDSVVIDISEDKSFDKMEDTAKTNFLGEEIELNPAIDPDYLLEETIIVLSDKKEITLTEIWKQLKKLDGYEKIPRSGVIKVNTNGPSNHLTWIDIRESSITNLKSIYLKRPGQGSYILYNTIVGYIDLETNKLNLFGFAGPETGDLVWDVNGDYLAYYTQEGMSAITSLHVYDVQSDELIEVSGFEEFKAKYEGDFHGEFKNLTWSEDGKDLYFEVKGRDDDKATSWIFNVQEKELRLEQ